MDPRQKAMSCRFWRALADSRLLAPGSFINTLPVSAETIAVGSEMFTPHRQDANSLYLRGHTSTTVSALKHTNRHHSML